MWGTPVMHFAHVVSYSYLHLVNMAAISLLENFYLEDLSLISKANTTWRFSLGIMPTNYSQSKSQKYILFFFSSSSRSFYLILSVSPTRYLMTVISQLFLDWMRKFSFYWIEVQTTYYHDFTELKIQISSQLSIFGEKCKRALKKQWGQNTVGAVHWVEVSLMSDRPKVPHYQ